MDQQQTSLPPTPQAETPASVVPPTVQPPAQAQAINAGGGSNKKMLMIVIVVIIVLTLLIGGGYYYYTTMLNKVSVAPPTPVVQQTSQLPVATTEPSPDQELNAITIDDNSSDFVPVDKDVSSL